MGGISSYSGVLAHRVVEWRGLGHILLLIKLMMPINLVYFTIGLVYRKKRQMLWWSFFLLHLAVFIVIALLSGSRGFLLLHFVFMLVIYHYLRKPIKLKYAIVAGVAMLLIASYLGAIRNKLKNQKSIGALLETPGEKLNLKTFSYGTKPLDIIFSREFTNFKYGTTFLTAVTNFIPRRIWPEKLDSGGVVLTKFARGWQYTGTTHSGTGLIVEGIINFGYTLGVVSGFTALLLIMMVNIRFYHYFIKHILNFKGLRLVYLLAFYPYIMGITSNLLFGEFCHVCAGAITKLALVSLVVLVLRLRIVPCRRPD
jgi:oligosaccharide repeat unit polymerase